jgi:hypothetical protein
LFILFENYVFVKLEEDRNKTYEELLLWTEKIKNRKVSLDDKIAFEDNRIINSDGDGNSDCDGDNTNISSNRSSNINNNMLNIEEAKDFSKLNSPNNSNDESYINANIDKKAELHHVFSIHQLDSQFPSDINQSMTYLLNSLDEFSKERESFKTSVRVPLIRNRLSSSNNTFSSLNTNSSSSVTNSYNSFSFYNPSSSSSSSSSSTYFSSFNHQNSHSQRSSFSNLNPLIKSYDSVSKLDTSKKAIASQFSKDNYSVFSLPYENNFSQIQNSPFPSANSPRFISSKCSNSYFEGETNSLTDLGEDRGDLFPNTKSINNIQSKDQDFSQNDPFLSYKLIRLAQKQLLYLLEIRAKYRELRRFFLMEKRKFDVDHFNLTKQIQESKAENILNYSRFLIFLILLL